MPKTTKKQAVKLGSRRSTRQQQTLSTSGQQPATSTATMAPCSVQGSTPPTIASMSLEQLMDAVGSRSCRQAH